MISLLFSRTSSLIFLSIGFCLLFGTLKEADASSKHYKNLRKQLQKDYSNAYILRFSDPCRSHKRLQLFQQSLASQAKNNYEYVLKRYQIKKLHRMLKWYGSKTRKMLSQTQRRCRRFWKSEIKRIGTPFNKSCRNKFGTKGRNKAKLWIGARPWAYVYLNGELCGTAPLKANVQPGIYKLKLVYPPTHDSMEQEITLRSYQVKLLTKEMDQAPKPKSKRRSRALSHKQLQWVIQKQLSSLRSCRIYQPKTKAIILSWQITTKGKVEDAKWEHPTPSTKRFQSCIIRAVKRWQFPKLKTQARLNSYTLVLTPTEEPE